ncbi:hypothetical protein GCM10020254_48630 [Streptomyces goshikiensis]
MASNLHEMTHPTASGHTIRLPAAAGRSALRFRSWAAYAQPQTGGSRQAAKQAGSDLGRLAAALVVLDAVWCRFGGVPPGGRRSPLGRAPAQAFLVRLGGHVSP